jgi:hypothetical protein
LGLVAQDLRPPTCSGPPARRAPAPSIFVGRLRFARIQNSRHPAR